MASDTNKIYNMSKYFDEDIKYALDYYSDKSNNKYLPSLVYYKKNKKWYINSKFVPNVFINVYDGTYYFNGNLDNAKSYFQNNNYVLTVIHSYKYSKWYINNPDNPSLFVSCNNL